MRLRDKAVLVLHECQYEKGEWIISVILQCCIFILVFFLFTVTLNIDHVVGRYLKTLYVDGYDFELIGYTKADSDELEKMGFRDVTFADERVTAYGYKDDLDHIWWDKIWANLHHKDIWNENLDEDLLVVSFCQIMLGAVSAVLILLMVGNVSNSVAMKLMRRQHYIGMLEQLGGTNQMCGSVFGSLFAVRTCAALFLAIFANRYAVTLLNDYLSREVNISDAFPPIDWKLILCVLAISMLLIWKAFRKQWRQINAV